MYRAYILIYIDCAIPSIALKVSLQLDRGVIANYESVGLDTAPVIGAKVYQQVVLFL